MFWALTCWESERVCAYSAHIFENCPHCCRCFSFIDWKCVCLFLYLVSFCLMCIIILHFFLLQWDLRLVSLVKHRLWDTHSLCFNMLGKLHANAKIKIKRSRLPFIISYTWFRRIKYIKSWDHAPLSLFECWWRQRKRFGGETSTVKGKQAFRPTGRLLSVPQRKTLLINLKTSSK